MVVSVQAVAQQLETFLTKYVITPVPPAISCLGFRKRNVKAMDNGTVRRNQHAR